MRRFVIFAALFFVALFIVSFVVAEADTSPANQAILKTDIQMDGAVIIEPAGQPSVYPLYIEQQLVEAIQPFDTGFFGHKFAANIGHQSAPAANAQSYLSLNLAFNQSMLIKKGGNAPSGVTNI